MKMIRIGLHSFVLVVADIAGIGGGALAAFRVLGAPNQVWLQLPIAVALSVVCFWAWVFSLRVLGLKRVRPVGAKELGACLAASLLWAPLVFVPLHYFTQGYLTGIGNLVALAVYQLPINAVALFGPCILERPTCEGSPQPDGSANRSQPISSQTNRTSLAAGSGG
jgi:hypothetical protein